MEVQRESLPGPSTLASASAGSTQDDCEYAESIDSDEHDLESEGSRSSEPKDYIQLSIMLQYNSQS